MKRILAIILALSILSTIIILPAFSAEYTVEDDLKFATSLGIISKDAYVSAEQEITRIELAEIFCNIIFESQNTSGHQVGIKFTDVPEGKQFILSTVLGLGVMNGYSETIFAPSGNVTYAQAVKALVCFLGYKPHADALGGYPYGYLSQASRLKIKLENNVDNDSVMTYGDIASLLKQAIGVDMAMNTNYSPDGINSEIKVEKGTNYLKYYRGISITKGVVTGNYLTNVNGGDVTNYFNVYIDGVPYRILEGAHGLQDKLGYSVYVYYTSDKTVKEAIYFEEESAKVLEIPGRDIISAEHGRIKYYAPETNKEKTVSFGNRTGLIYNGTFEDSYTLSDINPFTERNLDGRIKLVDNNDDGSYDIIIVTAYKTVVVNDVRDNKIYGMYDLTANPLDKVIDLSYYEEININIRNIDGGIVKLSSLKSGNVINVCMDKSGIVKEIIVSKASLTGVVDEVSYEGIKPSLVVIAGTSFSVSNGFVKTGNTTSLSPGDTVTAYFNFEKEIAFIDDESNFIDGYEIGYIIDAAETNGLDNKLLVKMLLSDGSSKMFEGAKKISLNGSSVTSSDVLTGLGKIGGRTRRQVVLYRTDLDGKFITAMQLATVLTTTDDAFNGFYQFPEVQSYYSGGYKQFSGKYVADTQTLVFNVPGEDMRDREESYGLTTLPTGESGVLGSSSNPVDVLLYGTEEDAMYIDIAVVSRGSSVGNTERRPFFVVSDVTRALNDDGDVCLKISGMHVSGTTLLSGSFFIDSNLFIDGHDTGAAVDANNGKRPFIDQDETLPEPGDVFRIPEFSETGEIREMNVEFFHQIYDYGDETFIEADGYNEIDGGIRYIYGTVVAKKNNTVKLLLPDGSNRVYELSDYACAEITKTAKGDVVVAASDPNAIMAESTHPGEASRLVIHGRGRGIGCFIFND